MTTHQERVEEAKRECEEEFEVILQNFLGTKEYDDDMLTDIIVTAYDLRGYLEEVMDFKDLLEEETD